MEEIRIENKEQVEKLEELGIGRREGDALILNKIEWNFSVSQQWIKGEKLSLTKAEEKLYLLYSYLRKRGYVVRFTKDERYKDFLRVGRKGFRKYEDRTHFLIKLISSKEPISTLLEELELSLKLRKTLVYCKIEGKEIRFFTIKSKTFP